MSVKNGNKPALERRDDFGSEFTERVASHPRIAYLPIPKTDLLVAMVIDELLVNNVALKGNTSLLNHLNTHATHGGEVLDGVEEVSIWHLKKTPGKHSVPDVAVAVWEGRKMLTHGDPSHIAPNHILIPPSNYHMCPWGPPDQAVSSPTPYLAPGTSGVRVTVIDGGFVTGGPIDSRLESHRFGEWYNATAAPPWATEPMVFPAGRDPLDQNHDCKLDALVGHANFVAGVVAKVSPTARIDVLSHNGSFVEADAQGLPHVPIPTEAAVARSLWETLSNPARQSDLINLGFAFVTLPNVPPTGEPAGGPPSWTFTAILNMSRDSRPFYVVAPAGNQSTFVPQYPAAFASLYPDNVIGVGSIANSGARSVFSNHGNWVTCCTEGEDVVSTFVTGWDDKPTEEADPQPGVPRDSWPHPPKSFSGWAKWSGTSFASPKIAGAIAKNMAAGMGLHAAWADVQNGGQAPDPIVDMGRRIHVPI